MLWCFPESGVASEKSGGSSTLVLLQVDVSCSLLVSLPWPPVLLFDSQLLFTLIRFSSRSK